MDLPDLQKIHQLLYQPDEASQLLARQLLIAAEILPASLEELVNRNGKKVDYSIYLEFYKQQVNLRLNFNYTSITELPFDFGSTQYLTSLRLDYNRNLRNLPNSFSQLNILKDLYLNNIGLVNSYLSALIALLYPITQLQRLELEHNRLDQIPETFWTLDQLQHLSLAENRIQQISHRILNLDQLKSLRLNNNQIQELPDSIWELTKLEILNLSNNYLTSISEEIGQLEHLHTLYLQQNQLQRLPETLLSLKNLRKIYIGQNPLAQSKKVLYQLQEKPSISVQYLPKP